jgi:cytoskeleton protein RodZ
MADLSEARVAEAAAPLAEALSPLASPAPYCFGEALKSERERQGLTREYAAARLRLPLRQVDALEAGQLDSFPKGPFLRGFIRNYAKELGIDAAPLLADLEQRTQPAAPAGEWDLGPGRSAVAIDRERWPRQAVIWGGALALGAFALIGIIVSRAPPEVVAPAATVAAATPAPAPTPVPAATTAETVAASPLASEAPAASAPAVVVPPPPELRIVVGSQPSWIEVTQSDGTVVLSGLQPAGAELDLSGTRPLKLVIGNASGVTIEAQGQAVPLAPHVQSNVARLTLP